MKPPVIIDAGPLVALINARDAYHAWTVEQLKQASGPLLTCEAALSEAVFLLRTMPGGVSQIGGMLRTGGLKSVFCLNDEIVPVCDLLRKYADVPMSLADACLVRMSELNPKHRVLTLDSDFHVYRRNRQQVIPLLTPE
jgi:predicted nucleic acid-binding protein